MKEVISPELRAYHHSKLDGFIKENQKLEKGGYVFAGDSITDFFPIKKYLGRDLSLINRGIAGIDTTWLLEHLEEQVWILEPEKVFIWLGTNDLGLGYSISDIINNYIEIISEIKSESIATQIYIISVLPVNESENYKDRVKIRSNKAIRELNLSLSNLAGVEFVDLYSLLLDAKGNLDAIYTKDGLHLTSKAYEILAEEIRKYL